MKRFTGNERWGLVLGVVMILGGLIVFVSPQPWIVPHETRGHSYSDGGGFTTTTVGETRFWGVSAIVFGGGLVAMASYRGRK